MEILSALRAATGPIHGRIEELPVCKSLLAGEVDREAYAKLLGSLYHLHEQFETELALAGLPNWPATPSRAAALRRDLRAFDAECGDVPEAVSAWIEEIHALGDPAAWAGVGYVLEGSRMGSRVLVKSISRGLGVEPKLGVGLDYHLDAGTDPNGNWRLVMAALAQCGASPASREAMVAAAVQTFEVIYALHEMASLQPC